MSVFSGRENDSVRQPSYSETVAGYRTVHGAKEKETQADSPRTPLTKRSAPHVQGERAVLIDMCRYKGAKDNFVVIREYLQSSLKVNKVTEKLTIKCLRPGPFNRIDVVFGDKDEADTAKQHTRWLSSGIPGARVKGEQW